MDVVRDRLDRAVYCIRNSFVWRNSPQGFDYWIEVYEALVKIGAIRKLQDRKIGNNIYEDLVREAIGCLGTAFIWSESPQGKDYWQEVVDNLNAMIGEEESNSVSQDDPVSAYDRAMGILG